MAEGHFCNIKQLIILSYLYMYRFICTMNVKEAQSCPTLCDPVDSTVHGILQARILEWVAFPFSRGSSQPRVKHTDSLLSAFSYCFKRW